jgi:hypothetical protein
MARVAGIPIRLDDQIIGASNPYPPSRATGRMGTSRSPGHGQRGDQLRGQHLQAAPVGAGQRTAATGAGISDHYQARQGITAQKHTSQLIRAYQLMRGHGRNKQRQSAGSRRSNRCRGTQGLSAQAECLLLRCCSEPRWPVSSFFWDHRFKLAEPPGRVHDLSTYPRNFSTSFNHVVLTDR